MIVQRLVVENLKGLRGPLTLDFSEGLTLVAGPNESGKSTLREALLAALNHSYKSKAKDVRALVPWNGAGPPRLELTLFVRGAAWKLEKTFMARPAASLYCEGKLVARNEQAEDQLGEVLRKAGEDDWCTVLWSEQGKVVTKLAAPTSLQARLHAAAGAVVCPELDALEAQVGTEHDRYYTKKNKNPNKAWKDERKELFEAEERRDQAGIDLQSIKRQAHALRAQQTELQGREKRRVEAEAKLAQARTREQAWNVFRLAREHVALEEKGVRDLETWLEKAGEHIKKILARRPAAQAAQGHIAQLREQTAEPPLRAPIEAFRAELQHLQVLEQHALRRELQGLAAPAPAELHELREVSGQLATLEASLEAVAMRLELEAMTELAPTVVSDGQTQPVSALQPGKRQSWRAAQELRLELPGVARLRVRAGDAATEDKMRQRESLRAKMAALHALHGSLPAAQARADQATQLRARLAEPPPGEDAVAHALAVLPELENAPADAIRLRQAPLPERIQLAEQTWKDAHNEWSARKERLDALLAQGLEAQLRNDCAALRNHLEVAPELGGARPALPAVGAEDSVELKPWRQALVARRTSLQERQAELQPPEGEEVTGDTLQQLAESVKRQDAEAQDLRTRISHSVGALENADLYSRYREAVEGLARIRRRVEAINLRAFAAKDLNDAVVAVRQAMEQDFVSPLQDRVQGKLELLTGNRYGVAFDRTHELKHIRPAGAKQTATVDALSYGTQEQLAFLTRLCLAEILGESGDRQLVIFDDNLVHTDNARMDVACRWLEEGAQQAQVIVFTCHPERYSFRGEVATISLEPLATG